MTPYYTSSDGGIVLYLGDCREVLAELAPGSVQTCVTSPPYFGLRDYGTGTWDGGSANCDHRKVADATIAVATSTLEGGKQTTGHLQEGYRDRCPRCGAVRIDRQIGLERTVGEYVAGLVDVFEGVRRVLADDGTLWLNLGDSYAGAGYSNHRGTGGLKPKDLIGVPWRVALALQAAGWWLRSDIVWAKPNPMPEPVTDRPVRAHEYLFLLAKSQRYYYDADAIREPAAEPHRSTGRLENMGSKDVASGTNKGFGLDGVRPRLYNPKGRNKRDVWTVAPKPFHGAHFAVFPPALVEPCVLAGSRPGDTVLDPFAGSGTTLAVALEHGRHAVGIELNPAYADLVAQRLQHHGDSIERSVA